MEDIEKLVLKVRYKADQQRFGNYPTVTLSVGTVYALCDESASLLAENEHLRSTCYPRDGVEAIIRERDAYKEELAAERAKYAELQHYNVDCTKQCGELQIQLSESQRRERAAVQDLTKLCVLYRLKNVCEFCKWDDEDDDSCGGHNRHDVINTCFEYRGPGAGEGAGEC